MIERPTVIKTKEVQLCGGVSGVVYRRKKESFFFGQLELDRKIRRPEKESGNIYDHQHVEGSQGRQVDSD